jgi:gamma-glutamylcysteine synthetase
MEIEKNNSGVRAEEENNNSVQYSAESDSNLTALCKELISVAELGLVHRRYGGVSTVSMSEEIVQTTIVHRTLVGYHGAMAANHNHP